MIKNKLFNIYYNWWKNLDKIILTLILLLFFLGLFFSLVSTSIIASNKLSTNSYFFFIKHFIFIFIGLLILIFSSVLERSQIIKFYLVLFFISLFFLILVPFIGAEVKGSKRWIDIAFLPRFQPIEILKPFMIVSLSVLLNHQKTKNIYKVCFKFNSYISNNSFTYFSTRYRTNNSCSNCMVFTDIYIGC